jgi:DHA1 family tetracycline resistance protein-like MFS transporter
LKPLPILALVCVIDVLGFGIMIPLVPYMAERFGTPPQYITANLGSYSLCQFLAAPLWGRLSDRYGRRPILIGSLFGGCLSYVILAMAQDSWWLLASRMLAGFMAGNISAAMAYASDISTPEKRAQSIGMVGASIGIGFMLGPAIGGVLAGEQVASANFVRPAIVAGVLALLAIALVAFVLPESHTAERRTRTAQGRPTENRWTLLRRLRNLRLLTSTAFLVTFSQATLESVAALWAWARFGFGPKTLGFILLALAAAAVIVQGGLVRVLVPKFGELRIARVGILSYVVGLSVLAAAPAFWIAMIGLLLCGLGAGAFNPSASSLASKQADGNNRGAVMGTYQGGTSLARVIAPFAAGPVFAAFGASAPFVLGACVTLPALWLIARLASSDRLAVPN